MKRVSQREEQSQESFEVQLDILNSTVGGLFSTAEEVLSTDERIAQKLNEEEMAKAVAREEHERIDFEKAL
ncbi:hypothetical protein Tco_0042028 [Tanacetum coccineum]